MLTICIQVKNIYRYHCCKALLCTDFKKKKLNSCTPIVHTCMAIFIFDQFKFETLRTRTYWLLLRLQSNQIWSLGQNVITVNLQEIISDLCVQTSAVCCTYLRCWCGNPTEKYDPRLFQQGHVVCFSSLVVAAGFCSAILLFWISFWCVVVFDIKDT